MYAERLFSKLPSGITSKTGLAGHDSGSAWWQKYNDYYVAIAITSGSNTSTRVTRYMDFITRAYPQVRILSDEIKSTTGIYRYYGGQTDFLHHQANSLTEYNGRLEAVFMISAAPRIGGGAEPIYRCASPSYGFPDFASKNKCDNQMDRGIFGYSLQSNHPEAKPFYACHAVVSDNTGITFPQKWDHFLSWDQNCEGQVVDGLIGYGLDRYHRYGPSYETGLPSQ
ncbi:hypothetical protein [Labrys sp. 22185]|uniref:hypothetical protein n=1 Tax=Labrys sp. 22185 TaxID=3453888 RepID=UPI003F85D9A3